MFSIRFYFHKIEKSHKIHKTHKIDKSHKTHKQKGPGISLGPFKGLFGVCPGHARAGFGNEGDAQVYYVFHDVADHGG